MTRRSLIKNMMGAIVGYALLPKCISAAPIENIPGIGGKSFQIAFQKGMFAVSDIIKTATGHQFLLNERTETGLKGILLSDNPLNALSYTTIEIIETEKVIGTGDAYKVSSIYSHPEKFNV